MWLVDKAHSGLEPGRATVPRTVLDPLIRWYTAKGNNHDEAIGVDFVRAVKLHSRWLACGCLGNHVPPPLMTPALLAEVQTYYIRRLVGRTRPAHHPDCPFFRDQATYKSDPTSAERRPIIPPPGFFAVVRPAAEHLAQQSPGSNRDQPTRPAAPPLLARLLWRLIEDAKINVVDLPRPAAEMSISVEFAKLRAAARHIEIAAGIPLTRLLFTHPDDVRHERAYARLRASTASWPTGSEPQAYALLFATGLEDQKILFNSGEPITVVGPIKRPRRRDVKSGPFLVIVAIGHHPLAFGFTPLEAWAQPILDGRRFVPIEHDAERPLLRVLVDVQIDLARDDVALRVKRPLFDVDPDLAPCRPTFLTARTDPDAVAHVYAAINLDEPETMEDVDRQRLLTIADDVVPVTAIETNDHHALVNRLRDRIMATAPTFDADQTARR